MRFDPERAAGALYTSILADLSHKTGSCKKTVCTTSIQRSIHKSTAAMDGPAFRKTLFLLSGCGGWSPLLHAGMCIPPDQPRAILQEPGGVKGTIHTTVRFGYRCYGEILLLGRVLIYEMNKGFSDEQKDIRIGRDLGQTILKFPAA